jgi:hypothetical protein
MEIRLPAVLYRHYGQHLIVWLWARASDDSRDRHGKNLGQGRATFRLSDLAAAANRSISTIRRWLTGARDKGLFWRFQCAGDTCRLWYCSLERVAALAGLSHLGSVAWIDLSDISADLANLRIRATEIVAQGLQRQSLWNARETAKTFYGIKNPRIPEPYRLVSAPCEHLARAVARRAGRLFVTEGFLPYGASQTTVGLARGLHPRTVRRHLSDSYRLSPSPVRGYRSDLDSCQKTQIAQRVPRSFPVSSLKLCASEEEGLLAESARFILGPGNRWFYLRCNVYWLEWGLSRIRYRRRHLRELTGVPTPPGAEYEARTHARESALWGWKEWIEKNAGLLAVRFVEAF